jgi:chromate transporter
MSAWVLYVLLLRATLTSFSGFASVPIVRDDLVVHRTILSDDELNAAIAISQMSPGPLGLYVVIVGYFVAGVSGALVGMAALATPALLALPLMSLVRRGRGDLVQGASSGIVLGSGVLMVLAALRLAQAAISSPILMLIAGAAFILVATEKTSPLVAVVLAATGALLVGSISHL